MGSVHCDTFEYFLCIVRKGTLNTIAFFVLSDIYFGDCCFLGNFIKLMASNPNRASSGAPKRRSTLAELGIKPNGAVAPPPAPSPKKPSPEPTTAAKRGVATTRASKTPTTRPRPLSMAGTTTSSSTLSSSGHRTAPSSPTVQRSASKQSPATARKTPTAINTAKASVGNATGAPKTPTPTTTAASRRRSMVSTSTSSSSQAPVSPLLRRGSTAKRMSSPAGPSPSPSSSTSKRAIEQVRELQKKIKKRN
ncbi:hypothetical protein BDA99DRAFT_164246 [Phascolomyces articulosus]|uniref:Uncharacterized protein n=1 Tax=Phascolomyces articulosus TaxID=60185 RepID=A0AAD5JU39_9FUNG|nr:hypothetical protein BDA99DRAFT_164246 [Phascolomyces articulosus]